MATTKKPAAKKETTKAASAKTAIPKKPRLKKEISSEAEIPAAVPATPAAETAEKDLALKQGKYSYAVGRRKTSVANVRLFTGKEKSTVNKKALAEYFNNNKFFLEQITKPLQLTGLESRVYAYINVNGGGLNSQAQAIAHGIAMAIIKHAPEFRKVLKKNGNLTRDSRMKERKKPGLKRARRGPQWAKR